MQVQRVKIQKSTETTPVIGVTFYTSGNCKVSFRVFQQRGKKHLHPYSLHPSDWFIDLWFKFPPHKGVCGQIKPCTIQNSQKYRVFFLEYKIWCTLYTNLPTCSWLWNLGFWSDPHDDGTWLSFPCFHWESSPKCLLPLCLAIDNLLTCPHRTM